MNYFTNKSYNSNEGMSSWEAPSNIALVKYWGKFADQFPCNSSISFTLKESKTITSLKWQLKSKKTNEVELDLYFEGSKQVKFQKRMEKFFCKLSNSEMPFIKDFKFIIETKNTFPHSAGIASSASAMASVALCLCTFAKEVGHSQPFGFLNYASHIARLGSGSAARSLYPNMSIWGEHNSIPNSKNEYAISFEEADKVFNDFCDTILIVSSGEKEVSSTVGHSLMDNHPMAKNRFENANKNCVKLIRYLKEGKVFDAGDIIEAEALELHALMMTSDPSFILMKPGTISIIDKVRKFRNKEKLPVFFTLDAGPNVHLLYPKSIETLVRKFIKDELMEDVENKHVLFDEVGQGPREING